MKKPYHDIIAWQKAHKFVLIVYRKTNDFPKIETYALVSQLRRAAVSVPANIVEGSLRSSIGEYIRFLTIAEASLGECEYFLELSCDLKYLTKEEYDELEQARKETASVLHDLLESKRKLKS